jgi:hypothetical protein
MSILDRLDIGNLVKKMDNIGGWLCEIKIFDVEFKLDLRQENWGNSRCLGVGSVFFLGHKVWSKVAFKV